VKEQTYIELLDNLHSDLQQVLRDLHASFKRLRHHQINEDATGHIKEHENIEENFMQLGRILESTLRLFFQRHRKVEIEAVEEQLGWLEEHYKKHTEGTE
jgi:hypothetical protein